MLANSPILNINCDCNQKKKLTVINNRLIHVVRNLNSLSKWLESRSLTFMYGEISVEKKKKQSYVLNKFFNGDRLTLKD